MFQNGLDRLTSLVSYPILIDLFLSRSNFEMEKCTRPKSILKCTKNLELSIISTNTKFIPTKEILSEHPFENLCYIDVLLKAEIQ